MGFGSCQARGAGAVAHLPSALPSSEHAELRGRLRLSSFGGTSHFCVGPSSGRAAGASVSAGNVRAAGNAVSMEKRPLTLADVF